MRPHHSIEVRHAKLFKNGRSQAVRIPRDFEFEGNEVLMHREGQCIIIEPVSSGSLAELFAKWKPLDDGLPEIPDPAPEPVDIL
jgi:antitoxin VapB